MSVYPMFGVSYFCVPIFMSSHLHVTLKMGWHPVAQLEPELQLFEVDDNDDAAES